MGSDIVDVIQSDIPIVMKIVAITVIVALIILQSGMGFWQNKTIQLQIGSMETVVRDMAQKMESMEQTLKETAAKGAKMEKQIEDMIQERRQMEKITETHTDEDSIAKEVTSKMKIMTEAHTDEENHTDEEEESADGVTSLFGIEKEDELCYLCAL